ncbi:5'-3' exoribonuclease 1 isoform X2 [Scaptodrosophila lebanonensis]|uniref:5'-3' exoribonuclease 1 n=1 Tax=Drosophila lebanonensis TaxID=7225 RepID=A0A6J2U1I8_DROLE|nr:5'-3' exoribonuclease 1 isoform X2 [Scaptodrosophila lebanonensis]
MGVPKFFRYISERYPCLSEMAREHNIPEFDNLYLDVNGIVHNCSHPDDTNIHFHLEEAQIFQEIFNYVDKLFYLIKPQKLFFMAVDGVAPRAKMNQQRSRRFRSAREAEQLETKALQRGERREHERFDSNCITPGTEFMERLQLALRCFLRTKISTDPLWQKCRVILSGQETPGEGEHKIMDYIRYLKTQPDFDPNTRHCLYGLDADLIILGLCTHELHFVVLREEVKFGRNVKRTSVEETRFFLLHLGLLREYLELEFHQLSTAEKKLDVAQLIDDWILMGFMVGNDFIPHLPCLHISSNALPLLYKTYIRIYPKLGGNINEHGKLNLERLQLFMLALSEVELQQFEEHSDDLKYMLAKTEAFDVDVSEMNNDMFDDDLTALIDSSMKLYNSDSLENLDEEASIKHDFLNYKRNYYCTKFKTEMNDEFLFDLSQHYVTALQWILHYYYRGVQSWDWYYPFHYAPFVSDLKNITQMRIQFELGTPFLPFQQLLAVLPAASSKLLPTVYHDLMLKTDSPLAEFFPTNFESDLNGKKNDWEAVVLIPFIDAKLLLSAMLPCDRQLSVEEYNRNKHGPMYQYDYCAESQGQLVASPPLKSLQHVYCTERAQWACEIAIKLPHSVFVELPNAARHVFFPGFPTMKNLPFDFELRHARIKVFVQPSRNENLILMPKKRDLLDSFNSVADLYLQKIVYVGWPHLIKAMVVKVATRDQIVDEKGLHSNESRRFDMECKSLQEHFITRMGIQFDNYDVLVYFRTYAGSSIEFGHKGNVNMVDSWSHAVTAYPAQGIVTDLNVRENMKHQFSKVEELFPAGCQVFFIGYPYYGSEGCVLDPLLVYTCGRIQVNITVRPEPNILSARALQEERDADFINSYEVCKQLNINCKCLGRLTGTVWVVLGPRREKMENMAKHNIGLQLKYPRWNEERIGYCRRINNQWFFSSVAVDLIREFCNCFPDVIDYLSKSNERGEYVFEQDIYPDAVGQHYVEDVANWVRQQPHMKVERIACGSKTVCKETVELLLDAVDALKALPVKDVKLQVKPHLLIKPNVTLPDVYKSRSPVRLFDRVIVVRTIFMVPVGIKGTIIGIYPVCDPNPVRLECVRAVETFCEVLFDKSVPNFNDIHGIAEERVYKVPESALVVIYSDENNSVEAVPPQHKKHNTSIKTQVEVPRKEQQLQTTNRYLTAVGTKLNPITMNLQIGEEFFTPPPNVENWRTARAQQPQQSQRKTAVQKTNNTATPTAKSSAQLQGSAGTENWRLPLNQDRQQSVSLPVRTSQAQTLALMSLLRRLPPPPPRWKQEAQQLQGKQEEPPENIIISQLSTQQQQQYEIAPQANIYSEIKTRGRQQQRQLNYHNPDHQNQQPSKHPGSYNNKGSDHLLQNNNRNDNSGINKTLNVNYSTRPQLPQMGNNTSSNSVRSSSIQGFVPIQAYRPKKSQAAEIVNAEPSLIQSVESIEATAGLMQALKIEHPTQVQPQFSNIVNPTSGSTDKATKTQLKLQRKPRKPRIGAKFDLDYILH